MSKSFDHRAEIFWPYYEAEIAPWLAQQEADRKKTIRTIILIGFGAVICAILFATLLLTVFDAEPPVALVIGAGLPLFMGGGGIWLLGKFFKGRIKLFLVPKVVQYFGYAYQLRPESFDITAYSDARLIPKYDRVGLEDSISGKHDAVPFQLCEAVFKKRSSSGSSTGTSYRTIQRALLLSFAFPKPFKGRTIVLKDRSLIAEAFKSKPAARVALEDPRFEKLFEAYGTDQVEARYLMTPAFMEKLVALADLVADGAVPQIAFVDQQLLIAIRIKQDRFEGGSLFTPMDKRARTEHLIAELRLIADLIDTLQLATITHA